MQIKKISMCCILCSTSISLPSFAAANIPASLQKQLNAMQNEITMQQHELREQAHEIAMLKGKKQKVYHYAHTKPKAPQETFVSYVQVPRSKVPLLKQASSAPNTVDTPTPLLTFKHKDLSLTFNGFVNALMMNAYDGKADNTFYGSAPPLSRVTFTGNVAPTKNFTAGGRVQLGFNINQMNAVSQANQSPGAALDMRIVEVFMQSKYFGTLSLGKGKTASDDTAYSDFSGTMILARATISDIGGGLFFRDKTTNALSSITVGNAINGLDGFSRRVRARYDTPSFHGLSLSTSLIEGERQDVALKYAHNFDGTKVAAQSALTSHQTVGTGSNVATGDVVNMSASVLLRNGLSLSGTWADLMAKQPGRDNPVYFYFKPGYQRRIFNIGLSAFSVDVGRYYDFLQNNSIGSGYGVQVVQNLDPYDLSIYAGYRRFHLSGIGQSLKSLNLVALGAMFKF